MIFFQMPREYKRKTNRMNYGTEALQKSLQSLKNGMGVRKVSRMYGVPCRTLRRHRDGLTSRPGRARLGRYETALPTDVEDSLKEHILFMENRLFGLTNLELRRLAFSVAERSGINHPFQNGLAGKDWLRGFLKRHPDISLRKPQGTSINRAVSFNKQNVEEFFKIYKDILEKQSFQARQIWNMDETGITTVQTPCKILAKSGKRSVGKIVSAERGQLMTVIVSCSAAGHYIPPLLIWPRKRMAEQLMKGTPPDSIGAVSDSGWTDGNIFLVWLKHFQKWTHSSADNPQLLIPRQLSWMDIIHTRLSKLSSLLENTVFTC